ncbi:MAG: ThiF family adenylyltransferase [Mobilitalea sp.]
MSIQLIDHNEDISRLKNEDYCVEIVNSNLVVNGIPYVNKDRNILFGTIYCPLTLSGEMLLPPVDHTVRFVGEHPCDRFGNENNSYVNSPQINQLSEKIIGQFYFSSKPDSGNYLDYYTKMKRYIELLSAPAKSIDPSVSAQKFDYNEYCEESVFKYPDTNSARAGISTVTDRIKNQKIAIVGLGGTGSYVLDFVCKTPVKQISLFDGDELLNHNAYRTPGAISLEELKERPSKVAYLKQKYSCFREGIIEYNLFLDETNVALLEGHDFVFLAIDNPNAKKVIIDYLLTSKIPFVDLGMGISVVDNSLRGTIRKTLITPDNQKHLGKIAMEKTNDNGVYSQNIQIAELNAMNAILGVITWKKLYGFYLSDDIYRNTTFILDEEVLSNET